VAVGSSTSVAAGGGDAGCKVRIEGRKDKKY
jgi:hypothetical protein